MRYIVFSDPHIHAFKAYDSSGSRLRYCLQAVDNMLAYAYANGINTVLCAGDWYETHKVLHTEVVNKSIDLLQGWAMRAPNMKIYCITGNHDLGSKNLYGHGYVSGIHHLAASCSNFISLDNSYVDIEGVRIYGIPYYDYKEDLSKAIDAIAGHAQQYDGAKILLLHNTPSDLNDPHLFADFTINDLRFVNFDQIYCGHIHSTAIMADHFCLVGNLLPKSTDDVGKVKGYWDCSIDLATKKRTHAFNVDSSLPVFRYGDPKEDTKDYILQAAGKVLKKEHGAKELKAMESFKAAALPIDYLKAFWEKEGAGDQELLTAVTQLL